MISLARTLRVVLPVTILLSITTMCAGQGSNLLVLKDDAQALQSQVDLIQQAQCTIDVAYYTLDLDEVPVAILELLRQASLRGVRVRILVDGLRFRLPSKFVQYLQRSGIELRLYHPPHVGSLVKVNRRMHIKLMVFDAERATFGSRNLENEHYRFDCSRKFTDCDALVSGEVSQKLQAYFDWLWSTPDVKHAPDRDSLLSGLYKLRNFRCSDWDKAWRKADGSADFQCLLNQAIAEVVHRTGIELDSNNIWMADAIQNLQIGLLHDCRSDKSDDNLQRGVVRMMDQAKCSLLIESPYPAFDPKVRAAISRASRRGVEVTLLTNSLNSTDHVSVYAAYQNQKRSLLREGVKLHEFSGKYTLHAKTMVIDDSTWMLGSYNFDARSDNLNLELCIVSHDETGAIAIRDKVQERLAKSACIENDGLLLPVGEKPPLLKRAKVAMFRSFVEWYRGVL